jgi:muramoyltetrapeptide carboxypeptidase
LFGEDITYKFESHSGNRDGEASAVLIGGNLSLLVAISGSVSDLDYTGKILFIEDVGEYLYAIDRMIRMLKRAGKLEHLAGLIVGAFTDVKDNDIPFGQTVPDIIMEVVKEYDYPVCFDFPAGHIPDNCSLILGRRLQLTVKGEHVMVAYN